MNPYGKKENAKLQTHLTGERRIVEKITIPSGWGPELYEAIVPISRRPRGVSRGLCFVCTDHLRRYVVLPAYNSLIRLRMFDRCGLWRPDKKLKDTADSPLSSTMTNKKRGQTKRTQVRQF